MNPSSIPSPYRRRSSSESWSDRGSAIARVRFRVEVGMKLRSAGSLLIHTPPPKVPMNSHQVDQVRPRSRSPFPLALAGAPSMASVRRWNLIVIGTTQSATRCGVTVAARALTASPARCSISRIPLTAFASRAEKTPPNTVPRPFAGYLASHAHMKASSLYPPRSPSRPQGAIRSASSTPPGIRRCDQEQCRAERGMCAIERARTCLPSRAGLHGRDARNRSNDSYRIFRLMSNHVSRSLNIASAIEDHRQRLPPAPV